MNSDYWDKRYAEMGGRKTVGNRLWSDERYEAAVIQFAGEMAEVLPELAGDKVLDFGCGIGRWTPMLMMYFDNYIGMDICPAAIEQATQANVGATYYLADGDPFEAESFDAVWTCVCLQHIVDPAALAAAARQIVSVLKPGGHLIITENTSQHSSNHYLAFRSPEDYAFLFSDLEVIFERDTTAMGQERHTTMVFRKGEETGQDEQD